MSYISTGTTTTTSLVQGGDTTGNLVIATGSANTTAVTISSTQNATFANTVSVTGNITGGNLITAGSLTSINTFDFKNRIINGGMTIDQRNAGASQTFGSTTVAGNYYGYTVDRWLAQSYTTTASSGVAFTAQQNAGAVTPPAGYINYLGATVTTAQASLSATTICRFYQLIEGLNVADLGWGTANAKTITLSAWVRSSLTGTFGGALFNSAANRCYVFSYSIPVANTWTQISVTIAGDTSGTWLTTTGTGISINFSLGSNSAGLGTAGSWGSTAYYGPTGQTNVVSTSAATFYLTGVQFEVGSQATSFDFRDYGRELYMCQRYCIAMGDGLAGVGRSTTQWLFTAYWTQLMRTAPAVTITDTSILISDNYVQDATSTGSTADLVQLSAYGGRVSISGFTGLTQGKWYGAFNNTNGYFLILSAELT